MWAMNVGSPWDQHSKLKEGHEVNAFQVDQPIAGLIKDLKARGLLDETLIIWSGEFGRTPFVQRIDGRDHNPFGFSMWLAGGGIKGGTIYGATDEYGYHAVENIHTLHDLHATVLHLLGLDHKRLAYHFGGRDSPPDRRARGSYPRGFSVASVLGKPKRGRPGRGATCRAHSRTRKGAVKAVRCTSPDVPCRHSWRHSHWGEPLR